MNSWLLDLYISPHLEHIDHWGLIIHIELVADSSSPSAKLWSRKFKGPLWMNDLPEPMAVKQTGEPHCLTLTETISILEALRNVHISLTPFKLDGGFHPETYSLRIHSGTHRCQLEWWDELPAHWSVLSPIVHTLETLGRKFALEHPL